MNILIYNWRDLKHSWAGGGEVYIFEQASRWVKAGHTVTLFCGQDIDKKLPEYEKIHGVHVYRRGGRYSLYVWAIWYYFTKFKKSTDVVVDVENGIPFFTPLFCRKPKICYVYHIHGHQFFYELPPIVSHIGYMIEKYVFPFLYRSLPIVAISETTKRQLIDIGLPEKNISVIYSGVNGNHQKKTHHRTKFATPTLLYLGRIKKYKRVDMLVHIFPKIIEKIPRARLVIAGWGTEASLLADSIMKSPLRRKISLLGPVTQTEKATLLSKSWLFVNPSIGEGWSIAVIEANLYGTPAVSFRVPGLSESIQHGKTGFLARNEKDFIDKICLVLNNKDLCYSLGENARKRAGRFNWNKTAQKNMSLIQNIVTSK